jgi:predicted RNA polymerase sigma factor
MGGPPEIALTERSLGGSIEHLLRELTPQVLGTVVRRFGDFAAAEDAVQEASLAAARQRPHDGLPDNPRAWLTHVAFRRMADDVRSDFARRRRESEVVLAAVHTAESSTVEAALVPIASRDRCRS